MGFVEAIFGKLGTSIEYLNCDVAVNPALGGTIQETLPLRIHFGFDFLAHGTTQKISFGQRIASQVLRRLLYLFLIGNNTKGFLEDRLQLGVQIFNLFLTKFARAIGWNICHRTGAIECNQCNQIFKPVRPHLAYRVTHA